MELIDMYVEGPVFVNSVVTIKVTIHYLGNSFEYVGTSQYSSVSGFSDAGEKIKIARQEAIEECIKLVEKRLKYVNKE